MKFRLIPKISHYSIPKMKVKHIVITIIIFGLTALVTYRIQKNKSEASKQGFSKQGGTAKAMQVEGIVIQHQNFANELAVTGTLEPNEQVEIRSQVSGILTDLYFEEGGLVKEGQILVKLDDAETRAQLSQAKTRQKLSEQNARRAALLLKQESISEEEYEMAEADLQALQAQTKLIEAQVAKTIIKAPFSGKIGLRSVSKGAYITPQTLIANLVNTNPIKLSFYVPEKYYNKIKQNTELIFTIAGSDNAYKAIVYAMEPAVDANTRTIRIRAKVDNSQGKLVPGTFAGVKLPVNRIDDAILAPTQAVIPVQNGKKVYVARGGKAAEILIETSVRTEKDVLVSSGLQVGDTLLISGIMSLKPGTAIDVKLLNTK
jgi:membrane fusion protein (multidrug efflux system)